MSATTASALVTAHALHRLLVELSERPADDATGALECARDYMEDVIAVLNEQSPFPARPPSPPCPPKRGGKTAILRCERALAQMRRTRDFLDKHFTKTEDEPDGWCPIEAAELMDQAMSMLEPISPEELQDDTPPSRPTLRVVRRSRS